MIGPTRKLRSSMIAHDQRLQIRSQEPSGGVLLGSAPRTDPETPRPSAALRALRMNETIDRLSNEIVGSTPAMICGKA